MKKKKKHFKSHSYIKYKLLMIPSIAVSPGLLIKKKLNHTEI